MTVAFGTLFIECLLGMTLLISSAKASSSRIAFSGAVVTPTCSVSDARIVAGAANRSGQFVCLDANGTADEARSYARTEVRLDANNASGNRLLGYFIDSGNGANSGMTEAMLVTRSFM